MTATPALQSPRLAALPGVRHAFFTRQGGVSTGLYASLNVGHGSNDSTEAVHENRQRVLKWFGPEAAVMNTLYQTHSATARVVGTSLPDSIQGNEGDALVTAERQIVCAVLTADCAPVLIADAEARVVASVHAGWRGALDGVVASAVATMVELGARPERMVAAVGPCIGPDTYEVGLDFLERFVAASSANERFFRPGVSHDKRQFDLPAYVLQRLSEAGVTDAEWIGRDTCAEEAMFFSNRRAVLRGEPDYGRLLSAIMLTP